MRDPKQNQMKRTLQRRRAALSVLILAAASPLASADQSSSPNSPTIVGRQPLTLEGSSSLKMLPPLPLKPIDRSIDTEPKHRQNDSECVSSSAVKRVNHEDVQANPFCLPNQSVHDKIQLASGSGTPSAIRLKPIGAAIGLQPIGSPKIVRSGSSAMTIEHPEPSVKSNPLIESAHRQGPQLVEAVIEPPVISPEATTITEARKEDYQQAVDLKTSTVAAPAHLTEVSNIPIDTSVETEPTPSRSLTIVPEVVAEQEPAELETSVSAEESEPITFSFSDESESLSIDLDEVQGSVGNDSIALAATPEQDVQSTGLPEPTILDVSENTSVMSVRNANDHQSGLVTEVPTATSTRKAMLNKKRYRPPVAVTSAPLSLEELAKATETDSGSDRIKPATAPMLGSVDPSGGVVIGKADPLSSTAPTGKTIPLYMSRAQVRSLTVSGQLHQVNIGDQGVCQAVASGSNQIKLIGSSNGVTRLVVWATPTGAGAPLMREFVVHVQDKVDATGGDAGKSIEKVNETIRNAFPESSVSAKFVGKKLLVRGTCRSEATAKKILRMVRKTCLVPVIDQVVVR